jgi:hypothetical protein
VEQLVKQLAASGKAQRIDEVINALTNYATSSQVGLQAELRGLLPSVVNDILAWFSVRH